MYFVLCIDVLIQISHSPHPMEEVRDFWTVGEIFKHVVSPHSDASPQRVGEETREILVGSIAIPIDGGPPRFDAVPSRRSSRIVTPQP